LLSYLLNSLIQISSSSKGRDFLWISLFSLFLSMTCRLFNCVWSSTVSASGKMNNFDEMAMRVDK
jgi:hypothetical protein